MGRRAEKTGIVQPRKRLRGSLIKVYEYPIGTTEDGAKLLSALPHKSTTGTN